MRFEAIDEGFEALQEQTNADEYLRHLGRYCTTECLLALEPDGGYHISIAEGTILRMVRGPIRLRSWSFAIRAGADSWREFWSPEPRPGFHDIFAMCHLGYARIEGDLDPLLTHLMFFKRMLAIPRGGRARPPDEPSQLPAPTKALR